MITLNLISPEQKNLLKIKQLYIFLRNLSGAFLAFVTIIATILILCNYTLSLKYDLNQNDKSGLTIEEKNVQELNKKIKNVNTVQNQYTVWSTIIVSILNLIPPNIELKNFEIDKTAQVVKIDGTAKTRNDYLNLITALENSKKFNNIKSPLENLLSKENINFSLSLIYQFNSEENEKK